MSREDRRSIVQPIRATPSEGQREVSPASGTRASSLRELRGETRGRPRRVFPVVDDRFPDRTSSVRNRWLGNKSTGSVTARIAAEAGEKEITSAALQRVELRRSVEWDSGF